MTATDSDSAPGFIESARAVALKAIDVPDDAMIRTAVQVLCIVGTEQDLEIVKAPVQHPHEEGRKDDERGATRSTGIRKLGCTG